MAWTTLGTVAPGDVLRANSGTAAYNSIIGNLDAIGGAWTSYTPTWTNLTVGNATQDCAYIAAGKLHIVRVKITLGSTSSVGTGPEFTLPNAVSLHASYNRQALGIVSFLDGTTLIHGFVVPSITTAARCRFNVGDVGGTYIAFAAASATVPFTWGSGDSIEAQFMFEAA